jgi:Fe2+ transport system protein FeoA
MAKASKRPGPKSSLVEEDEAVAKVKRRLFDKGHRSMSQAAMSVGFQPNVLIRIIREGLSGDPHQSTVERLDKLGILDLVRRRNSA